MRKPRDYEKELKALGDRAKLLKERKVRQLGELVIAASADMLDPDVQTGALLAIAEVKDTATMEGWRARGAEHFRCQKRKADRESQGHDTDDQANPGPGASS